MWMTFRVGVCVRVSLWGTHLSLEGVDDEVQRVRLDTLDALLHHMVTILVLHTLEHVAVQLPHHLALQGGGEGGEGGGHRQRPVIIWGDEIRYCRRAFLPSQPPPHISPRLTAQQITQGLGTVALEKAIEVH